jgi:hypothetical protein
VNQSSSTIDVIALIFVHIPNEHIIMSSTSLYICVEQGVDETKLW